jgi:hypothetical protein
MKNYKNYDRGQWAEQKLCEVINKLPNNVVSDIGSGFGWFNSIVKKYKLIWQPFDYVKKIENVTIWDLNNPVPLNMEKPGFVVFMEVLEHLSNPELGIKNISNHIENGGYMVLTTPNPLSAQSKASIFTKNALYNFQSKHLVEHHVFVPLPHIVEFHLENNGFIVLEKATIGKLFLPKFKLNFNYIKELIYYGIMQLMVLQNAESKGHTQAFFVKKTINESIL